MNPQLYNDYGSWIRSQFNFRIQKISIDGGFSCPNRDGTVSAGGCTFCDNRTFNPSYCNPAKSIREQIQTGKDFFARKYPTMRYLAYDNLAPGDAIFFDWDLDGRADHVGIVIGTRPDCVTEETLDYLEELSRSTFVIVEYGIESVDNATLKRINRGHTFECSRDAIIATHERGILTGGHIILGLPGETAEDNIRQAAETSALPLDILKLHQLQIIRGTQLAEDYLSKPFKLYTADEYIDVCIRYIERLRKDLVLERFVSQSPADMLIAPKWGIKNHEFTDRLVNELKRRRTWQGRLL